MYCELKKSNCIASDKKPCWCILKDEIAKKSKKEEELKRIAQE